MRPLKITITAFGPYKNKEVIDFTELKENRLFVVSGNTGAGKTTIFDAITFALYGSASGEDRSDPRLMRSDFADDDVHTSVELEFELHGRYYRILRQLPHVKQGNKGATGEQYEFYEKVDGREVPCVDRQIVSEINKRVEELVGLTKDQFSQIVMLPQGEFRKLLTSQTENKEEILRKIFKTEPYKWISERLKDKKKNTEEAFKREAQTRDRYINDIYAALPEREMSVLFEVLSQEHFNINQVVAGLEEEVSYYGNEKINNKKHVEVAETIYNKKLGEYHDAKNLNVRFQELDEKDIKLGSLNAQLPAFKLKEEQFESAERASKIEAYETQVNDWREDEKKKVIAQTEAENVLKIANDNLVKAQDNFEIEEKKQPVREEIVVQLNRLNDFLPIVKEIDSKEKFLAELNKKVQLQESELSIVQTKLKEEKSTKEKLSIELKGLEKDVDQLADKQQKLSEMRDHVKSLRDYLLLQKNQANFEQEKLEKEKSYQTIKEKYDSLEQAWVSGQASVLATHLHDGKPCPVCGSLEHPNKAQNQDAIPTKEELETVKAEFNEEDSAYRDVIAKLKSNSDLLAKVELDLTAIGVSAGEAGSAYNKLVEDGKAIANEVEELVKSKDLISKLRETYDSLEQNIAQLETKKEVAEKAYQEQRTTYEKEHAVYTAELNHIPEDYRTLSVLEDIIRKTQLQKVELDQAWEQAQKGLQFAKEEATKASANVTNADMQLKESMEKRVRAEKQFEEALASSDFDSEGAYRQAKMSETERKLLKESIEQFNSMHATVKLQVQELRETLKDKVRADLSVLSNELEELKRTYDIALEVLRQSEQYQQKAEEIKNKILEADKSVSDIEKQLNIVTDLYDVVRGQNSSKISFERYLQIEFLEQIIIAANERLRKLSNGQFLLIRSERQESRGKQSGLGLDVYDAYTGQTRDVKTLSGGEKFNASLCLALGMADVIQSFQGGVSIETMFIDEGFGSLDEESLNKAIDTLIDLQQSGRMIGVISHVQDLKNAIPAILEVKKTKEGYSQTQFVLK